MNAIELRIITPTGRHDWLRFAEGPTWNPAPHIAAARREYPDATHVVIQPHTTHTPDASGHCRLCGQEVTA
ncbi:MAG: hypothetical protein GX465_15800 [Acidobacteria bacterium]|nr:hypothetical protein [Acidobacteriota bacterium]